MPPTPAPHDARACARYHLISVLPEDIILAFLRRAAAHDEWISIDFMMGEEVLPGDATREDYEAAMGRLVAAGRLEQC
jgi:hypothetical protein